MSKDQIVCQPFLISIAPILPPLPDPLPEGEEMLGLDTGDISCLSLPPLPQGEGIHKSGKQ